MLVEDFDVHRNNDIGLPRVSGWTSSSSAASKPGCLSINGLSPPPSSPQALRRLDPRRHLASALITVFRLIPDAVATAVLPPRPSISAAAPATTRRCSSFMCGKHHLEESRERLRRDLHTLTILRAY